jgi:hypothetical protein
VSKVFQERFSRKKIPYIYIYIYRERERERESFDEVLGKADMVLFSCWPETSSDQRGRRGLRLDFQEL